MDPFYGRGPCFVLSHRKAPSRIGELESMAFQLEIGDQT